MPGTRIDGNDPAVVRETVADLAEAAREGGGPAFVELTTQRLVGHYIGDVQQYRTKEELEADGLVEPITIATAKLTESGVDTDAIEREVREEVETAAQQAIADPVAYVSKVKEHLYA
jgi:pyruvate dehydrogenase E1 component alpha subunit